MKRTILFRFVLLSSVILIAVILASCQNDKGILDPNTTSSGSTALSKSSSSVVQRSINDFLNNQTVGWYWFDNNDTTSRKYLYADYA